MVQKAHPAKGVLAVQRTPLREVAADLGYCEAYVGRVLNGRMPVSAEFRLRLSDYLGRPESELFCENSR